MLFLRQNQQCQSTEGKTVIKIKQVVKVMCHKTASPPQMDGSIVFARWRQRALPRWHIGATWRMRLNLCFLQATQVHNQNSKLIGSAAFAQLTARSPYTLQWAPLPPKLSLPIGGSGPHLIHGSLGPTESSTHMASRSVQPFLQGSLEDRQTDRQLTTDCIYVLSMGNVV